MSTRDFISGEADVGSESEDNDYDEETGEPIDRPRKKRAEFDDSSEEEDDDDEEEEQKIREGFIVDEDDEDIDEDRIRKRKERRKRRREEREQEEEVLDEEDLDLIGEANPDLARRPREEPKFKRLKRGHREDESGRGAANIFDSDEDEDAGIPRTTAADEFDDFIEDDDPGEQAQADDAEVSRGVRATREFDALKAGLDEDALEDFNAAFGNGDEYGWALDKQAEQPEDRLRETEDGGALTRPIELKDVFEPSQLAERMLTEEDNIIRTTDEPERFQIARRPYKGLVLTDEQQKQEAGWIAGQMWLKKSEELGSHLRDHFQKAIAKVLEFFNVDEVEPGFIFHHRKDYLLYLEKNTGSDGDNERLPHRLLELSELWEVFRHDLRYRALTEKRNAVDRTWKRLKEEAGVRDPVIDELLPAVEEMEQLQDLQEYLYFQHASAIGDLEAMNGSATNGTRKKPGSGRIMFEKIRKSKIYGLVRAFGKTADAFAQDFAEKSGRKHYTEDAAEMPEVMAAGEDIIDPPEYSTANQCLRAARMMFAEELFMSPRLRKAVRQEYYASFILSVHRTEKGLKKIDELHPYYEFKYLKNQTLMDLLDVPGRFLRMIRAEEEGLIELKFQHRDYEGLKKSLYEELESDGSSYAVEAWNRERSEALSMALSKLDKICLKSIKEFLKATSETAVAKQCRDGLHVRLDQAPWKPRGHSKGTVPKVLAMSNGAGHVGRDPINWIYLDEEGRMLENGRFLELQLGDSDRGTNDGADVARFIDLVERRHPEVVAISGHSIDTKRLHELVENIISARGVHGPDYNDDEGTRSDPLDVVIVNDEVARLYQTSDRAQEEYPSLAPLSRYCIAIARYLQDPLIEYASLGKDIISIKFDRDQAYLDEKILLEALETALCDIVSLVGVKLEDAILDNRVASLLPYVAGLGPRKAQYMVRVINNNGGSVSTRAELVGDPDQNKAQAVGPRVWNNCAAFLWIPYEPGDPSSDYLDNSRIHPEDYEIARKMAADALEMDEEDIMAEIDAHGTNAVLRKLVQDGVEDRVNDLILDDYSKQLEEKFNQRKRSTLETIRLELQGPFEEIRGQFHSRLSSEEKFTMFTGESPEALKPGMTVSLQIKRVSEHDVTGKLDCGVDGAVSMMELPKPMDVSAKTLYQPHQMVQAYLIDIQFDFFRAELSLLDEKVNKKYKPQINVGPDEWDNKQEAADTEILQPKEVSDNKTRRIVKHPYFKPYNASQAQEYLFQRERGDLVIRPSSKGPDHLVVTWKVAEGIYQHLDILELNKENEFSIGKILKIGNSSYSDLDELIVTHVKAMARKVEELMSSDKFQKGSRDDADLWLKTYTEANPRRSAYAFCLDPKHPGCAFLCYKKGQMGSLRALNVKVIPRGYSLHGVAYASMVDLQNGFKSILASAQNGRR